MLSRPVLAAAWGWLGIVAIALVWSAVTWARPYGWIVAWEIENGHGYSPGLTLGVLALVLTAPAMWVLRGHEAAVKALHEADPEQARRGERRVGRWMVGLAVVLALGGSFCLVRGLAASDGSNPVPITIAQLRDGNVPDGPVVLRVTPDDDAVYDYTEFARRSSNITHTYRGVRDVEGQGKTGPLALFTAGESRDGNARMLTPLNGFIEVSGFIEQGGLPDFVRRDFAARGIEVADAHFVLHREGPRTAWLVGMGISYALAFVMLLVGGIVAMKGRRRG